MSVEFRMPDVGEGIAEVELLEWHVEVGAEVREYDTLATIQTDKSIIEMPSPVTGRVVRLGGAPGDMLPVGDVLIVFDADDAGAADARPADSGPADSGPADSGPADSGPADSGPAEAVPAGTAPTEAGSPAARPKAAPAVRRLALDQGVDLALVRGTGPGGRITRQDVQLAAAGRTAGDAATRPAAAQLLPQAALRPEVQGPVVQGPVVQAVPAATRGPAGPGDSSGARPGQRGGILAAERAGPAARDLPDEHVPLRGLRRQIAKKMTESWRAVPHITDWREADATQLIEARRAVSAHWPAAVGTHSYVPFFVKITAVALRRHPLLNASFDEAAQEYVLHRRINIGIATATPDGLLVPVVRDADAKTVVELAEEITELVALARERKATLEQLTGGTYTVNNFGAIGGQLGTPIIRTPEVGILGFGRISDRVVAVDGAPAVRPTIMLSSVGDHRLHDGDTLGAFTSAVVRLLEHPYALLGELR
jgi:pyruvate/2-oxoglutarate dehydrogenase complex dihydrolipoamide acyltransferase (E2) component